MKSARYRSRLYPADIIPLLSRKAVRGGADPTIGRFAHARRHGYQELLYTAKTTVVVSTDSTPRTPVTSSRIIAVKVEIPANAAADSTWDVLIDGVSIFYQSNKPVIVSGTRESNLFRPDRTSWQVGNKLTIQCTAGVPAGPALMTILYQPGFR